MADSVREASGDVVTAELIVDGKIVPDDVVVKHISVDLALNHLPRVRITLRDGDPALADFEQSAGSIFVPGHSVDVQLGYDSRNTSVFRGLILGQTIRNDADGASELVLNCSDVATRLSLARTSTQFSAASDSDSDLMARLISDAGLGADVEPTIGLRPQQVHDAASDWDLLLARADANGMVVAVADGKVSVARPTMNAPALMAEFGDSIASLDLELDASQQFSAVTARAWNADQQATHDATATEPTVNRQGNISGKSLAEILGVTLQLHSQTGMTQDALQSWADAQLLKSRLARIRGTVGFAGNAGIRIGDLLELKGLGARFDGAAYVSRVCHRVEAGDWRTEVTLGLSRD